MKRPIELLIDRQLGAQRGSVALGSGLRYAGNALEDQLSPIYRKNEDLCTHEMEQLPP